MTWTGSAFGRSWKQAPSPTTTTCSSVRARQAVPSHRPVSSRTGAGSAASPVRRAVDARRTVVVAGFAIAILIGLHVVLWQLLVAPAANAAAGLVLRHGGEALDAARDPGPPPPVEDAQFASWRTAEERYRAAAERTDHAARAATIGRAVIISGCAQVAFAAFCLARAVWRSRRRSERAVAARAQNEA